MQTEKQSATKVDNVVSSNATEYGIEFICDVLERRCVDVNIDKIRSMYDQSVKAISREGWYHGKAISREAAYSILNKLTPGWLNE